MWQQRVCRKLYIFSRKGSRPIFIQGGSESNSPFGGSELNAQPKTTLRYGVKKNPKGQEGPYFRVKFLISASRFLNFSYPHGIASFWGGI